MFEKTIFWHFYNCLYDDLWQREHTFMPSCVQCTFFDTRLDKIGEIHWCIHENFESTFLCFIISFCTFDFCDGFFVSTTHFKCTGFYFLMHTFLVFSTPALIFSVNFMVDWNLIKHDESCCENPGIYKYESILPNRTLVF